MSKKLKEKSEKLDNIVANARNNKEEREKGYRERALKQYPWICGRCSREFTRENVHELTVHHRDHNHDNNPLDGSNWELLCLFCHDNEHSRYVDNDGRKHKPAGNTSDSNSSFKAFAGLADMLKNDNEQDK